MAQTASRPVPTPSIQSQPFWEGCAWGELLLQRCKSCQTVWHPPSPLCPSCFSTDYEWAPASGKGTVYTFSVIHHPFRRVWEPFVPYTLAVIELAEGPKLLSNVIDIAPDDVQVGMAVEVTFQQLSDTISLPLFRPVKA